jgi:hypothetical protein
VLGRAGGQPSPRLCELTLAAHAVAATGLVPGDRHVDETLQEVTLVRRSFPPGVLELLVRGEIPAGADQLEPLRERHAAHLFTPPGTRYPPHVATILLVGVDLFFRGKLEGLLPGHHLVTVDSIDPPDLVIADIARIDPDEVAEAYPDCPILGYANHSDTAGLRRAHAAGFDQVIVKAALDERAAEIVQELTSPLDSGS